MGSFRDRLANFMSGRYGMDEFGKFINMCSLVTMITSIVISFACAFSAVKSSQAGFVLKIISWVFFGLSLLFIIYGYFRILSKNYAARTRENIKYCEIFHKSAGSYGRYRNYADMTDAEKKALDKRTHKIFKCPNCTQKIRVPRNKGRICIKCPKCRIEFIKKT